MIWLIILSPLIIFIPIAIYFDLKTGASDPKLDTDNYRIDRDLSRNFISYGGDDNGSN